MPPKNRAQGGGKIKGQVSTTPGAIRKRAARSNRGINEDIVDIPDTAISEHDVETVFDILTSATGKSNQPAPTKTTAVARVTESSSNPSTLARMYEYTRLGRNRK